MLALERCKRNNAVICSSKTIIKGRPFWTILQHFYNGSLYAFIVILLSFQRSTNFFQISRLPRGWTLQCYSCRCSCSRDPSRSSKSTQAWRKNGHSTWLWDRRSVVGTDWQKRGWHHWEKKVDGGALCAPDRQRKTVVLKWSNTHLNLKHREDNKDR